MKKAKIRGAILFELITVVIIIALLAAMAVPAYQKVRITSQNKAITKNLRMIAKFADQYFLQQGVDTVAVADLVGPDKPIQSLNVVAGETYPITVYSHDNQLVATGGALGDISIDF